MKFLQYYTSPNITYELSRCQTTPPSIEYKIVTIFFFHFKSLHFMTTNSDMTESHLPAAAHHKLLLSLFHKLFSSMTICSVVPIIKLDYIF